MQFDQLSQRYEAMVQEMLLALSEASGQALQGEIKIVTGEPTELTAEYALGVEFPLLSITVSTAGAESNDHVFLVERSVAGPIYSWMVGGDAPEEITDEHIDAVKETAGQIIGQLQAAFDGEEAAFTPGAIEIFQVASAEELTLPENGLAADYKFTRGDDETEYTLIHIVKGDPVGAEDAAAPADAPAEGQAEAAVEQPEGDVIAEPELGAEAAVEQPEGDVIAEPELGAEAAPKEEDDTFADMDADDAFAPIETPAAEVDDFGAASDDAGDVSSDLVSSSIDDIFGDDLEDDAFGSDGPVEASPANFDEFSDSRKRNGTGNQIDMLLDVELDVTVELGRKLMLVEEILRLGKGSVVELDKLAGEPVDILVNGRKLAEGEVVVVEDHFGVRLTHLIDPKDRIRSLGRS